MKRRNTKNFLIGSVLLAAFTLWTAAVHFIDVQPIGPNGSSVGFASVNGFVHKAIGVHLGLYTITDWLGLIPTAMMQLKSRINHIAMRKFVLVILAAFAAFMVIGSLVSGVHWLTDITGGVLLSAGLVTLYAAVCNDTAACV